jgi:hypothetical protein
LDGDAAALSMLFLECARSPSFFGFAVESLGFLLPSDVLEDSDSVMLAAVSCRLVGVPGDFPLDFTDGRDSDVAVVCGGWVLSGPFVKLGSPF